MFDLILNEANFYKLHIYKSHISINLSYILNLKKIEFSQEIWIYLSNWLTLAKNLITSKSYFSHNDFSR